MKPLILSILALIFTAPAALALETDTAQPVYIDSDSQQLDMKSNKVTFVGNVSLKQGSINITADTLSVTRDEQGQDIKMIQATGKPAKFSQLLDDGRTIKGQANDLQYMLSTDQLTMTGKAQLAQDGNLIQGSSIKYQIAQQKLMADGSEQERVTTVLQPSQIKSK
ncbi:MULTISPECIES: lipopolysaccharide transport periplasmic protein LptA [unclassified Vibrio]|uniref:Lipopolysaccharide export system protein LptA n=1 Tax=Vibrio sp. HB236076 TaxID=3232307 RepID=A0AB39HGU8_9VIBR|nr:lipopolysaccharide transport periplasmic protein LptA [Vibrio sp. HB161653]MDP5255504.1 lipopolysaccharide transport periplasmic protein LptA [Vibrio sp. HB161653]